MSDKVVINELSVDPKKRSVRLGCPTIEGEKDLGSSAAQYFGYRPNGTPILGFEHAKQRLCRGDVGHITEGIAVEKDPLEPLGIDNVERQVMVGNTVEKEDLEAFAAESSTQLAEEKLS